MLTAFYQDELLGGFTVLPTYYLTLEQELLGDPNIESIRWQQFAGHPFLYIKSSLTTDEVYHLLLLAASKMTFNTRLSIECQLVRSVTDLHVFRFRFLVPEEKMFCCGNQCEDCTRLPKKS